MNTLDNGGPEDTEEILMMLPPLPDSIMTLPKIWQASTTLLRFTSIILSHSSMGSSKNGVALLTPGQFISTSTCPVHSSTSASAFFRSSGLTASAWKALALPPASSTLAHTARDFS
ncbi:hypothetical protein D3C75_1057210 [compost metagenome]